MRARLGFVRLVPAGQCEEPVGEVGGLDVAPLVSMPSALVAATLSASRGAHSSLHVASRRRPSIRSGRTPGARDAEPSTGHVCGPMLWMTQLPVGGTDHVVLLLRVLGLRPVRYGAAAGVGLAAWRGGRIAEFCWSSRMTRRQAASTGALVDESAPGRL
ncbi:hypothetical protein [Streptomyces camponoticapitis]|uniref:hypothetical protein n=1 Tax=Streptomyces camponoticapitis TaxID=1616125 RepID=UPI001662E8AA|nr:hypothetical protein [Streptomyces camponoticapitis]